MWTIIAKGDFHKLIKDLVSNDELDLWALDVGIGYVLNYNYCDSIDLIETQIKEVEKRIGAAWYVKVKHRINKKYEFSNLAKWEQYKDDFITPRLNEIISACSKD